MTIESYINQREEGTTLNEIKEQEVLSEATVWTLELGYQCFLKKLPLDQAIEMIKQK